MNLGEDLGVFDRGTCRRWTSPGTWPMSVSQGVCFSVRLRTGAWAKIGSRAGTRCELGYHPADPHQHSEFAALPGSHHHPRRPCVSKPQRKPRLHGDDVGKGPPNMLIARITQRLAHQLGLAEGSCMGPGQGSCLGQLKELFKSDQNLNVIYPQSPRACVRSLLSGAAFVLPGLGEVRP